MTKIDQFIADFASFVWGLPLLILLIGGGFYLLIISKFLPFRYLGHAFQVLSTALSATE
jgi:AGCS family alanine or glycine:cation symporter